MVAPIVIVGGGVAGGQAAQTLRAELYDGPIVLIGEEPERPYERPPLSKQYLQGESQREWLFLRQGGWYEDNGIELRLGRRAVALDPSGSVDLDDGSVVAFSKCLIATGGRPRRLAGDALYLRTLADADALRSRLAAGARVCVVGAGFIGAEVASAARTLGCDVTMLEVAPLPLGRVLGPELGTFYADLHRSHGVDLRLSEGVEAIDAEGVVGTSGTRFRADVVVVGVGIEPATELASSLETDSGIVVDEYCRTSAPNVYAAGDCARFPDALAGRLVRVEHFQNAQRQGAAAARAMIGMDAPYREVTWFWSDQYDVNLQMLGFPGPDDDTVERGSIEERSWIRFSLRGDVVAGAIGINRGKDISATRRLIERRIPIDRTRLADESTPLRELLRY